MEKKIKSIKEFLFSNKYILIILIVSFILQVWGINFGLPYIYNSDEPIIANRAVSFFTGDFNPHWYGYPGSFLMNILFLLYGIYFIIGLVLGHYSNITEFINLYKANPTIFYLLGRSSAVVFGTLSIYILYKIIVKLFNHKYALISAIILAIAPLYIYQSKLILPNIPQTLLILFSLYYFIKYLESKKTKDIYIGCMFFGFSVATKWPSLLLLIPLLITIFLSKKENIRKYKDKFSINILMLIITVLLGLSLFLFITRNELLNPFFFKFFSAKNFQDNEISRLIFILKSALIFNLIFLPILLICFLLANFDLSIFKTITNTVCLVIYNKIFWISLSIILISFLLMAPFVLFDFFEAIRCVLVEARSSHIGHDGLGFARNVLYYIKEPFNKDFGGIGLEIFLVIGILLLLKDWKKLDGRHLVLFSFPFSYFFAIARLPLHWPRWSIPIFPFLAILSAIGLNKSLNLFKTKQLYKNFLLILILIILLFAPFKKLISDIWKLSQKDTRTVSKEWIESNLPQDSVIAYERYAPHLHIKPKRKFKLLNMDWTRIVYKPLDYYINQDVDYIIITSVFKERFYNEPERYKEVIKRYEFLEARTKKIKTFTPSKFQPGPIITIYQTNKDLYK